MAKKPSLLDFVKTYAKDLGQESMAQGAGHVEHLGSFINSPTLAKVGTDAQEYWRKGQSPQFKEMPGFQKTLVGAAIDPANALLGGLGRLIRPAAGFKKARPALNPAAIWATKAYDAYDNIEDADDNNVFQ